MQVYAWAGMLVSYSQDDGLLKAAKDTFSGEKPCELCCKIAEAKKEAPGKEPLAPTVSGKLLQDMIASEVVTAVPPRFDDLPNLGFPGMSLPVEKGTAAPPTPPPRTMV